MCDNDLRVVQFTKHNKNHILLNMTHDHIEEIEKKTETFAQSFKSFIKICSFESSRARAVVIHYYTTLPTHTVF